MAYLSSFIEIVNEIIIIPLAIATFILLIYITLYLKEKDRDIIRSKIFLRHNKFDNSFQLFTVFSFVLVLHVSLIYVQNYLDHNFLGVCLIELQEFFGLVLAVIMLSFAYLTIRTIK